jgi:dephospho-CoA kinase
VLRVGLTGSLGSGKSTVAQLLRELGAEVAESDDTGRALMEPGQRVYEEVLRVFGREVADADGRLNRPRLAQIAFNGGRVRELNAIVHPAVIEAQQQWMQQVFARDPAAVAVVVSALIFEVERDAREGGSANAVFAELSRRIDRIVVVTAPDEAKIARYVARVVPDSGRRAAVEADARSRLAHQIPDAEKALRADYLIENTGDLAALRRQVEELWPRLKAESNKSVTGESLK